MTPRNAITALGVAAMGLGTAALTDFVLTTNHRFRLLDGRLRDLLGQIDGMRRRLDTLQTDVTDRHEIVHASPNTFLAGDPFGEWWKKK